MKELFYREEYLLGWKQESKEEERKLYGKYCNKMRKEDKEPAPFHIWQKENTLYKSV